MNTNTALWNLYVIKDQLKTLGKQLSDAGCSMAAEEVAREAEHLGERASQLHGVLDDYKIDIATVQAGKQ
ncbi:hypothetical protein [Vreelandella populi]|uniref:Uncharacterized protein n=1 Tax=Vreelandella populi TaxID=2498858 RepID=A0A433LC00_9GAMM|nr:hypothetical protein [Halomonas populi]RUR46232.1 hypothetical protein ELY37_09590 [Halomonas populi]